MSTSRGKVTTGASVSLDGFIAGPDETGFEHLFAYMGGGDVEVTTADPNMTMRMTADNAAFFHDMVERHGAIVCGRHLYDFTQGWGGVLPMGCPVVVMTHEPPERPSFQRRSSPVWPRAGPGSPPWSWSRPVPASWVSLSAPVLPGR